jgi:hypothetical protein
VFDSRETAHVKAQLGNVFAEQVKAAESRAPSEFDATFGDEAKSASQHAFSPLDQRSGVTATTRKELSEFDKMYGRVTESVRSGSWKSG